MSNKSLRYHTCTMQSVSLYNTSCRQSYFTLLNNGDINTILFAQKVREPLVREPKWLPSFNLTGAIFSLWELWLPCSRVFVFSAFVQKYIINTKKYIHN